VLKIIAEQLGVEEAKSPAKRLWLADLGADMTQIGAGSGPSRMGQALKFPDEMLKNHHTVRNAIDYANTHQRHKFTN
jgi:acyl carrier protein